MDATAQICRECLWQDARPAVKLPGDECAWDATNRPAGPPASTVVSEQLGLAL